VITDTKPTRVEPEHAVQSNGVFVRPRPYVGQNVLFSLGGKFQNAPAVVQDVFTDGGVRLLAFPAGCSAIQSKGTVYHANDPQVNDHRLKTMGVYRFIERDEDLMRTVAAQAEAIAALREEVSKLKKKGN
jgi:hypothetical protein